MIIDTDYKYLDLRSDWYLFAFEVPVKFLHLQIDGDPYRSGFWMFVSSTVSNVIAILPINILYLQEPLHGYDRKTSCKDHPSQANLCV